MTSFYQDFGSFSTPLFPSCDEQVFNILKEKGNLVAQLDTLKSMFEALRPEITKAVESFFETHRISPKTSESVSQIQLPCESATNPRRPVTVVSTALTPSPSQSYRKSNRGRPAVDPVLMFKIIYLGTQFHLADERLVEEILDRTTFRHFLDVAPGRCPSRQTIWKYREIFKETSLQQHISKELMDASQNLMQDDGEDARIIDSSFTEAPVQHNTPDENLLIKHGAGKHLWPDQPHKKSHKDIDARWTKKGGKSFYGYKFHVKVSAKTKLILNVFTTPANVHDSQIIAPLLDASDKGRELFADAGYQGKLQESIIRSFGMTPVICEKAQRGKKLTETQKANNRRKSKTRCRIEHVFGFIEKTMGGSIVRYVGQRRCEAHHWMTAFCYNVCRLLTLRRMRQAANRPALC